MELSLIDHGAEEWFYLLSQGKPTVKVFRRCLNDLHPVILSESGIP